MPKATAVFDADDSRLSGALARINGKMLALQSRIAKFAAAFVAVRAVAGVVTVGFDRFKDALDVGGKLSDLSANTGIAVLQLDCANAGKSAKDIGLVFGKMAKTLPRRAEQHDHLTRAWFEQESVGTLAKQADFIVELVLNGVAK